LLAFSRQLFAKTEGSVVRGMIIPIPKSKVTQITDKMLIKAAENLAGYVKKLNPENILPRPLDKGVVKVVAKAIK
jgi:malic enzyme